MLLEPAKESLDVCLVVSDIAKSLDFYQRTLGLHKTEELQTRYGTVHRLRYGTSLFKLIERARDAGFARASHRDDQRSGRQHRRARRADVTRSWPDPGDDWHDGHSSIDAAYPMLARREAAAANNEVGAPDAFVRL